MSDAELDRRTTMLKWTAGRYDQRAEMLRANARLAAIHEAMPLIRSAAARGDARGTYNALATVLNTVDTPSSEGGR